MPDRKIEIEGKEITLTKPDKEVLPGVRKKDIILYYGEFSESILPHLRGRPLSLFRFPDGPEQGFFQKNIPDYFPDWIDTYPRKRKSGGEVRHAICNNKASLIYLANQVAELHPFTSKAPDVDLADRMVFDLDPEGISLDYVKKACEKLRRFLEKLGMHTYLMTTGGKGYHIVIPLEQDTGRKDASTFAGKIAATLAKQDENITTEFRKEKRKGKVLIDTKRNSPGQTAVAPFTVRAKGKGNIAAPISWDELQNTQPDTYSISNPRIDNPWADIEKNKISMKKIQSELR